jgi:uncharacterized cupin superfamily protein
MPEPDVTLTTFTPDSDERLQWLGPPLGVSSFGINVLTLRPRQRMRVHIHERQEEVYVVLDGELTLIVEGAEHRLRRGQLARVGPATRRQVVNRGPERLVLLVVGASAANTHDSGDARAWQSWEESGDGRPALDVALPEDLPAD